MLPFLEFAYRQGIHETTKETPYILEYGRGPATHKREMASHCQSIKTLRVLMKKAIQDPDKICPDALTFLVVDNRLKQIQLAGHTRLLAMLELTVEHTHRTDPYAMLKILTNKVKMSSFKEQKRYRQSVQCWWAI